jgi:hypothetical protein
MQHMALSGGLKTMEIDHHDASLSKRTRDRYDNLFLSSRHCNNSKRARPTRSEKKEGKRFLNPCKEQDYGFQVFEDPRDHHVWGTTLEARYHIIYCDLNAPHLMRERTRRTHVKKLLSTPAAVQSTLSEFVESCRLLQEERDLMIHDIAFKKDPEGLVNV